ncbi:sulfite exporter TauE/SafE family protein [Candidatus Woesearchaeota archaeon]|nr:sulfite exporter TauE/SafE family protein [Candidatus Woesearchaeota archaeon]
METLTFALLLLIGFIASIIGTMMGMAMLIIPPAMIFLGIPVHNAVATSRFSMLGLNIGSISRFSIKGKIKLRYALPFAVAGILGAVLGASYMARIDAAILKGDYSCFAAAG